MAQPEPRFITAAEVEGQVIPEGGTTDQLLAKNSNEDFDLKWKTGGGGGIGGSIADQQVAFGDGTDIAGSSDLLFDKITGLMTIGYGGWDGLLVDGQHSLIGFPGNANSTVEFDGDQIDIGAVNTRQGIRVDTRADIGQIVLSILGGAQTATLFGGQFEIAGIPIRLLPVADPPASPSEGMIYADTDHHLYYYNGTTWKQLDN